MPQRVRTRPRKTAVQARSVATVEAILHATARVLIRDGYDHASTNKIAEVAGVSIGSLYQYFPSKEALVAELLDRHMDEMRAVALAAVPRITAMPIEGAAKEIVRLMVDAHAVNPKLHKVFVEQVPRIGRLERVQSIEREMIGVVKAELERRQSEIAVRDLELSAYIVVGIVEALTHAAVLTHPELLGEAFIEEVALVLVRYLKG